MEPDEDLLYPDDFPEEDDYPDDYEEYYDIDDEIEVICAICGKEHQNDV